MSNKIPGFYMTPITSSVLTGKPSYGPVAELAPKKSTTTVDSFTATASTAQKRLKSRETSKGKKPVVMKKR